MAVSLPWPQTSLTGKNSLDNRMGVPGPIRRARAVRRSCERVGGVGFDTPQVIRPASHQNRAPPGLGD